MLTKNVFQTFLKLRGTLIIDGALATELEARGHDLNHPLWSAKTLQNSPESIQKVHLDYYRAGADVAITASYQATTQGLKKHFNMSEDEGIDLIKKSVQLAQNARETAYNAGESSGRKLFVAGSVGPYGAYLANGSEYTGDYDIPLEKMKDFHRPRIQALVDARVDILALETMPNLSEIKALLALLEEDFPEAIAWLTCTVKSPDLLADGTPWKKVLSFVNQSKAQIMGFGINCVPISIASETLKKIRPHTGLPLVCYPNSGEIWDATTNTWHGQRPDTDGEDSNTPSLDGIQDAIQNWTAEDAKLVGGCCRTGPAFIQAIRNAVTDLSAQ